MGGQKGILGDDLIDTIIGSEAIESVVSSKGGDEVTLKPPSYRES